MFATAAKAFKAERTLTYVKNARANWACAATHSLAKLTVIRCAIRVLLTVIEPDRMLTGSC
jgi:hypothetical protein